MARRAKTHHDELGAELDDCDGYNGLYCNTGKSALGYRTSMPTLRRATPGDRDPLCRTIVRAFVDDPVWTWMFPRHLYAPCAPLFAAALFDMLQPADKVWIADAYAGGAFWAPPGPTHDRDAAFEAHLPALAEAAGGDLERLRALGLAADGARPTEPHWYLSVLGTDPDQQGKGAGSALLGEVLARCDAAATVAFLETETPRNVAFYQRRGFVVVNEADLPGGGPHLWFMRRPPRMAATR